MVSLARRLVLGFGLICTAAVATAEQHPIAFQIWAGSVPSFNADPSSLVSQANDAFLLKYGAENGLLGTAVGSRGELLVLAARQIHVNQMWKKMTGSGDAFVARGVGYFRFQSNNIPPEPTVPMTYIGKLHIEEGQTAQLIIPNGTPEITAYALAMEEKCGLARSGVVVARPGTPLIPTRLVKTERIGSFTISYEHQVNGGQGALLSAINVTLARRGGPFIIDICPVDVYARF